MCFSETYLTPQHDISHFLNQHTYEQFRVDVPSEDNHMGLHGVMLCAKKCLQPRNLYLIAVEGLESQTVLVERELSPLVVTVVDRSPSSSMSSFLEKLETLILLMPSKLPTIILGDFNQNLFDTPETNLTGLMRSHGFTQYVSHPTTDSGSLLDHAYFNRCRADNQRIIENVHDTYYSDHDAIFLTTNILK